MFAGALSASCAEILGPLSGEDQEESGYHRHQRARPEAPSEMSVRFCSGQEVPIGEGPEPVIDVLEQDSLWSCETCCRSRSTCTDSRPSGGPHALHCAGNQAWDLKAVIRTTSRMIKLRLRQGADV